MSNLIEYLKEKAYLKEVGDENIISISNCSGDRFKSFIVVYEEEPKTLYIARRKLSGLILISEKEVLGNHNNLNTTFNVAYKKFIEDLKASNVEYVLGEI